MKLIHTSTHTCLLCDLKGENSESKLSDFSWLCFADILAGKKNFAGCRNAGVWSPPIHISAYQNTIKQKETWRNVLSLTVKTNHIAATFIHGSKPLCARLSSN